MSQDDPFATLHQATASYDGAKALDAVDLALPEDRIIAFCGPNGSGKSTALRVLRALHKADSGTVEVAGRPVESWHPRELAREVAMLSQSPSAPDDMSVADLALLGRYAHRGRFAPVGAVDHRAVNEALAATSMANLAQRNLGQLSGGQLQRAWIAMVLAQDSPRIFLDEPTNHLDLAHALDILDLITALSRKDGRGFVIVLHDLNYAMRYADHVVLFNGGRIEHTGPTQEVLTEDHIRKVFQVDCRVVDMPGIARPIIVPLSRRTMAAACPAH